MIKVKNHQIPPTIRVDRALGISSEPGAAGIEDTRLKKSLECKGLTERLRIKVGWGRTMLILSCTRAVYVEISSILV